MIQSYDVQKSTFIHSICQLLDLDFIPVSASGDAYQLIPSVSLVAHVSLRVRYKQDTCVGILSKHLVHIRPWIILI